MEIPTLRDVYRAKKTIAPYIPRTPLHHSLALSELLNAEIYLKHEEHLPLGAFKGRGGINLLANLSQEERDRGIITASTGNHGQSIASACRIFGVRVMIGLPEVANPLKVAAMKALGAELIFHGDNFDEAKEYCDRLAKEEGYLYVHPVNEPLLVAGVATQALEVIEDLPDVETLDAAVAPDLQVGDSFGPLYRRPRETDALGANDMEAECHAALAAFGIEIHRSDAGMGFEAPPIRTDQPSIETLSRAAPDELAQLALQAARAFDDDGHHAARTDAADRRRNTSRQLIQARHQLVGIGCGKGDGLAARGGRRRRDAHVQAEAPR